MSNIEIIGLNKSYEDKVVFKDLNLTIPEGETTYIMGPSGCGKTTLMNILMGLDSPDSGEIKGVSSYMSTVFQEDRLFENYDAIVNIAVVAVGVDVDRITEDLLELGIEEEYHRKALSEYSGGMKRRVAIVRSMLFGGDVFLMDEPFKGLDKESRRIAREYVKRNTAGKTVVIVTHEEEDILPGSNVIRM